MGGNAKSLRETLVVVVFAAIAYGLAASPLGASLLLAVGAIVGVLWGLSFPQPREPRDNVGAKMQFAMFVTISLLFAVITALVLLTTEATALNRFFIPVASTVAVACGVGALRNLQTQRRWETAQRARESYRR